MNDAFGRSGVSLLGGGWGVREEPPHGCGMQKSDPLRSNSNPTNLADASWVCPLRPGFPLAKPGNCSGHIWVDLLEVHSDTPIRTPIPDDRNSARPNFCNVRGSRRRRGVQRVFPVIWPGGGCVCAFQATLLFLVLLTGSEERGEPQVSGGEVHLFQHVLIHIEGSTHVEKALTSHICARQTHLNIVLIRYTATGDCSFGIQPKRDSLDCLYS